MQILVTGGGGFLGLAIVQRLLSRGHAVRTFSRGAYPALTALGVTHHRGEITDATAVGAAVAGCDVVIHTAAKPGVWGPYKDYYDANVRGTELVLDACRKHGVRHLVFTSSPSAVFSGKDQENIDESVPYPTKFLSYYAQTKALSEQWVMAAHGPGLATVSLRPRLIWGPGDPNILPRLLKMADAGQLRLIDGGRHVIDHTYIDNAADAHLLAMDRLLAGAPVGGKTYFISNGEPMPAADLFNRMLAVCRRPPVTASIPRPVALLIARACEGLWTLLRRNDDPPTTRMVVLSMGAANWFNLAAARNELGYTPQVSTDEGLRRLAASQAPPRPPHQLVPSPGSSAS